MTRYRVIVHVRGYHSLLPVVDEIFHADSSLHALEQFLDDPAPLDDGSDIASLTITVED